MYYIAKESFSGLIVVTRILRIFARAFHDDCQGNREIWHRVYGWTSEALEKAITQSEIVA